MANKNFNLIFLGSSGGIQVPLCLCTCQTCEEARKDPELRRTRASVLLSGKENILIDAGPDIEFQLEREKIKYVKLDPSKLKGKKIINEKWSEL